MSLERVNVALVVVLLLWRQAWRYRASYAFNGQRIEREPWTT